MKNISISLFVFVCIGLSIRAMEEPQVLTDLTPLELSFIGLEDLEKKSHKKVNQNNSQKKPFLAMRDLCGEISNNLLTKGFKQPEFIKEIKNLQENEKCSHYYQGVITGLECFKWSLDENRGSINAPGQEHIERMLSNITHFNLHEQQEAKRRKIQEEEFELKMREGAVAEQERMKGLSLDVYKNKNHAFKPIHVNFTQHIKKADKFHHKKTVSYVRVFDHQHKNFESINCLQNESQEKFRKIQQKQKELSVLYENLAKYQGLLSKLIHIREAYQSQKKINETKKQINSLKKEITKDEFYGTSLKQWGRVRLEDKEETRQKLEGSEFTKLVQERIKYEDYSFLLRIMYAPKIRELNIQLDRLRHKQ